MHKMETIVMINIEIKCLGHVLELVGSGGHNTGDGWGYSRQATGPVNPNPDPWG